MNDDLDRLLERANELENDEELESPSENINEEVVSKSDDDTSYFGGEFHERDKLSVNNIVDEVKDIFSDYSMSVIKARALPDLRDGLNLFIEEFCGVCMNVVIHQISLIRSVLLQLVML